MTCTSFELESHFFAFILSTFQETMQSKNNLCHSSSAATAQLVKERGSSDDSIFRTRDMLSLNLDFIPVLPGPTELLRIPSFDEVDDAKTTTTCSRTKQLSDLSTFSTQSINKEDPESTTSFEFFKRAFASKPNTAVVIPARWSTTCPMSPVSNKQAKQKNANNRRRVKQISDMTEMTSSMSFDDASSAPYMHTPPSNVSFLRSTHNDVDPTDCIPYPSETSPVHIEPTSRSTGTPPAELSPFAVPAVPTLTASSFEEKEEYRSFRRNIKVRLNRMAKAHYTQSKSK